LLWLRKRQLRTAPRGGRLTECYDPIDFDPRALANMNVAIETWEYPPTQRHPPRLIFVVGFVISQIFNPHKDSWVASAIEKISNA